MLQQSLDVILSSLIHPVSVLLRWATIVSTAAASVALANTRPNVLFIVCDDLNTTVEGFTGAHPQASTPNLARFAESATRFQRAYSNAPICAPSRASFLTGIYPSTSGNYHFDKWFENEVLANSKSLMGYFKANGYRVAGTGKLFHQHRRGEYQDYGYHSDYGPFPFDGEKQVAHPSIPGAFHELGPLDGTLGPLTDVPFGGVEGKGWVVGYWREPNKPWRYESETDRDPTPDELNAAWAADYLRTYQDRFRNKPFFLSVGFIRPHTPMVAPDRFFEKFPLDEVKLAGILPGDLEDTHLANSGADSRGRLGFDRLAQAYGSREEALRRFTQAYLACVAAVDENVGEVLDALEESGQADNTIVVITSDHGFHLGEKDHILKNTLWEEATRVPLLVRVPGMTEPGSEVFHPVSLVDLYPTLADLCGLEGDTRVNEKGRPLDGHSLRPFLENPSASSWSGSAGALSVVGGGWGPGASGASHHYSVRSADWRYIRYADGEEELYDHRKDPREHENLAESPEYAAMRGKLEALLDGILGEPAPNATLINSAAKPFDWFTAVDADKSGDIPLEEWMTWSRQAAARKKTPFDEDKQRKAFLNYFDANKDGVIIREELERDEEKEEPHAKGGAEMSAEEWKNLYFERNPAADANGDGQLSWPEYRAHKEKKDGAKVDPPQAARPDRLQTDGIFTEVEGELYFLDSITSETWYVIQALGNQVRPHLDRHVDIVADVDPAESGEGGAIVYVASLKEVKLPGGKAARHFPPPNYSLVWEDPFDDFDRKSWSRGLEADHSDARIIWNPETGGRHLLNDGYAGYITDEDAYIENGTLVLRNQKRPYQGEFPAGAYEYTSGWVNSMNKRFFNGSRKGVYIEIRAKFPSGLKVWPAIWMVPENDHWPPEIDLWEYFGDYWTGGDKMFMRYFYPKSRERRWKPENHADSSVWISNFDRNYDCESWHTYGFHWTSEEMVWSIDGQVVRQLEKSMVPGFWPAENLCLVMNNAVATAPPDENTTWPNFLLIDSIKVFEKQ